MKICDLLWKTAARLLHGVLILVALSSLALPVAAQEKVWRVGFLALRHVATLGSDEVYGALLQGMREFGYIEGKNLVIELRSADGNIERLPSRASELVRANGHHRDRRFASHQRGAERDGHDTHRHGNRG